MPDISPDREDIAVYLDMVFGYCDGLIPCRSFAEKGADSAKPPQNIWLPADAAIDKMLDFANRASRQKAACYVIPGTVEKNDQAKGADIKQMQVILVDIDTGNTDEKLATLTAHLPEPTMIVESGGITDEGFTKLHIYWKLSEPAAWEELHKLLRFRHHLAICIGGDTHFKSAHQPIRIAGSVYHKDGNEKLVKIRKHKDLEYNLDDLIEQAENLPKPDSVTESNSFLDFNDKPSIAKILTTKVREGGKDEYTRFESLSSVIGYWLRRYHDGIVTEEQAWEEITSFNQACVAPPWPEDRLKYEAKLLWKKHIEKYGDPKAATQNHAQGIGSFSLGTLLGDTSPMPDDIISPRLLTPGGILVFGGAPKVGKSDFLLSMFVHLAAGLPFLSFTPPRPLRIFYLQAEIQYHYLRERLQAMQLPDDAVKLAENNLLITPKTDIFLNEDGVKTTCKHIEQAFIEKPDIIAIDPLRNVFDGGGTGTTENDNDAMIFFLQQRIERLRNMINPDAGVIIIHHTKKISRNQFLEDPFQAFSGASSLRGYYTSGMLLFKQDMECSRRSLYFELRNGKEIAPKLVNKENGIWIEENIINERIANQKHGKKLDAERNRKNDVILSILTKEAIEGKIYTKNSFCELFENKNGLGSKDSILDRIEVLSTKGYIKFTKNIKEYIDEKCTSKFGLMCTQNMEFVTSDGELKPVLPTHYKHHEIGTLLPVKDPNEWIIYEEDAA